MNPQIALTLTIIAVTIVLFATERLRVDVVALLVLLTVGLTGLVSTDEVFAGFSNSAVITVWAVYIVSGGMFKTGVANMIGQLILRAAGPNEARLIAIIMVTCGTMSAFMNNVGATAMLLPAMVAISRQTKIPLSKLLIPLAFSSLMGGNMTLIGTPANILASNILADRQMATFSLFDFLPTGLVVFATGILYMVLIGRHLLPARITLDEEQKTFQIRDYVSEVSLAPDSKLAGKTLEESRLGADYDLTVLALVRDGSVETALHRNTRIQPGDHLIVEGSLENLMRAREDLGLVIEPEKFEDLEALDSDEFQIIEATLAPRSRLVGRTLRDVRFRDRYGFTALALWRQGEIITRRLRDIPLQFGDALLLQGPRRLLPALREGEDFLVLEPVTLDHPRRRKAPFAVGIMALVLGLVLIAEYPISLAMVIGSVLMVLAGCLTMDEAYESIDWRTVFLVAGMLPLGMAMESTGTAQYLANLLLNATGRWGPMAILAGLYILSALITQPMSNAAAVVLMVPIALDTALSLGANHQPFVLATVIGASTSFLTPVGHKANVLVFGPGGYHFFDYTRVGLLLTLAILIASLITIPIFWPLFP